MTKNDPSSASPRSLARALGQSATGVVNLVVAGSAAVGAAALHSWPVLALGAAAYAALVAWDTAGARSSRNAPMRPGLPAPDALFDSSLRESVRAILSSRSELASVLEETGEDVKAHLALALTSVQELEDHAARLLGQCDELTRYLARTNPEPIRKEVARLAERARAARDEVARAEYENARKTREEQLTALEDIAGARDRGAANIARIVATLEGLPAKIVRMRALDAQAMNQLSGSMSDDLERMNQELSSFEDTLRSLGEIRSK